MSSPARAACSSIASVALFATIACSAGQNRAESSPPPNDRLSEAERVAHVLSRLTYGPRPGDAERVAAMGVDRWIAQQLKPETIAALATLRSMVIRLAVQPNDLFFAGKVIRAQVSERQLAEVLADFWANHFSVYSGKMPSREALIVCEGRRRLRELLQIALASPEFQRR